MQQHAACSNHWVYPMVSPIPRSTTMIQSETCLSWNNFSRSQPDESQLQAGTPPMEKILWQLSDFLRPDTWLLSLPAMILFHWWISVTSYEQLFDTWATNVTGDIWRWRHGRTITPGSKLRKATELGVPRTSRHAESSCRCYCRISGEFWFPTWTYYWIIFIFYIHIYWFILYSYYVYLANLANLVPLGSFYLTCSSLHGLTD